MQTLTRTCFRAFFAALLTGILSPGWGQIEPLESARAPSVIAVVSHSDFVPDRVVMPQASVTGLPDSLAARIIEHLTTSRRFVVVERPALRRVILEQRFGQRLSQTYLDRTLDKAITIMDSVQGGNIKGTSTQLSTGIAGVGIKVPLPVEPRPVGGGIAEGSGDVGTIGVLADYNDILKDFLDLGTAVDADYLVIGNLEKLERATEETPIPYSTEGRTFKENVVDARLRLRVVDVKAAIVTAVTSFRTKVEEIVFEGKEVDTDEFSFLDHLGRLAAVKVLDVTFPARIISVDPLVVSRGTNDGTKAGDVYAIVREGREMRDANGVAIGNLHSPVGVVQVAALQDTFSVVRSMEGAAFAEGDLALFDATSEAEANIRRAAQVEIGQGSGAIVSAWTKPRVAVGLIKSGSTARTGKDADEHTPIFTDTIISRLTQTRRFQMIDRQEVDQLLTEQLAQALVQGRNMPSAMGTLEGADYLVYGSLASFSVEDKQIQLPSSSRTFTVKTGHVQGNMRIVDARSGDIVESRAISVSEPVEAGAKGSRTVATLANAYAKEVVLMLMNAAYPIKIAAVGADGMIYINRGDDGGLAVGEILNTFRPGRDVIDPDTGVQLGVEESLIGQVTVQEVEDARSKGVLTIGNTVVMRGDILKRIHLSHGESMGTMGEEDTVLSGEVLRGDKSVKQATAYDKFTLAVGLVRINPAARTSGFGEGHAKRVTDDLVAKLTNSNRFVLMERQEIDQILDEKAFEAIVSGGDIQDRLRELQGADYLIHGEISNFYFDVKTREVAYLDEKETHTTGVGEGTFRIVDVHAGAVIAADKVRVKREVKEIDPIDMTEVMSNLIDEFTTKSVGQVVGRLYPIKVLGISDDGFVYVNRGSDAGLSKGDQFRVMRPGQELIDPDTGLPFGHAETIVGMLEIVVVEPFRARARLLPNGIANIGDILRVPRAPDDETTSSVMQPAW